MSMTTTPAAAQTAGIDAFLMDLPYGQWIPMPEASRRLREAGLPREALTAAVRRGRRRGVLRTEQTPQVTLVMRVGHGPSRQPNPPPA
ncbi:hypothetical protein OG345_41980 (plasmid) [Streptomyces sp. NBC_01220]|uniref:hypothetical protein n=1 Tax=Streptomyces sp. NBC_01220 TaxID=2903781 RepID=UPI00352EAB9A|nr:hypothetical protein OG345_41980 [Streptomyces sp. NBC_01220]